MAETVELDRNDWAGALEKITNDHGGQQITIEVLDQNFGDQQEIERLPFSYIDYDRKDEVVVVAVGGKSSRYPVVLRHMIWHPASVNVAEEQDLGTVIQVVEEDGTTNLITFHR